MFKKLAKKAGGKLRKGLKGEQRAALMKGKVNQMRKIRVKKMIKMRLMGEYRTYPRIRKKG